MSWQLRINFPSQILACPNIFFLSENFLPKITKNLALTSNLSKAHVTRDSIGAATWGINVQRVKIQ